ncbi:MAG TPA: hypothetical protein VH164_12630, partial [Ktedonobacteraceae bacterium]|nr:hypothetical protein [Ktedonobacteraceae bacterium]
PVFQDAQLHLGIDRDTKTSVVLHTLCGLSLTDSFVAHQQNVTDTWRDQCSQREFYMSQYTDNYNMPGQYAGHQRR